MIIFFRSSPKSSKDRCMTKTKFLVLVSILLSNKSSSDLFSQLYHFCFRKSVEEYYEELTNISDFIVEKIFADQPNLFDKATTKNIRSVSICVSLDDIQILCDMISKASSQLTKDEAKVLNYVTKY